VRPLLANSFIKNRQPYADLLQINTRPSAGLFRSGINAYTAGWMTRRSLRRLCHFQPPCHTPQALTYYSSRIGRVMQTFADARASAERIWQLLDERPAIRAAGGAVTRPARQAGKLLGHNRSLTLQPMFPRMSTMKQLNDILYYQQLHPLLIRGSHGPHSNSAGYHRQ
jgi:hypothetical protein